MPPPGLQIYIRPRVTLTFDLLTTRNVMVHATRCVSRNTFWFLDMHTLKQYQLLLLQLVKNTKKYKHDTT